MRNKNDLLGKISIANQLWVLGVCVIVVLVLIFSLSYYLISHSIIKENINYTSQVLSQVQKSSEDTSSSLEALLLSMGYNRPVAQFLSDKDSQQDMNLVEDLDSIFYNVSDVRHEVSDIVLLGKGGQKYYKNGSSMQKEALFSRLPDKPNYYYSYPYYFNSNDSASFVLSTSIYNVFNHNEGDYLGTISFIIDYHVFGIEKVKTSFDTRIFMIDDRNGKIYASNAAPIFEDNYIIKSMKNSKKADGRTQVKVKGNDYIVNSETMSNIHMKLISVTPKKEVLKSVSFVKWNTYIALFASSLLFIILFRIFIKHVTNPLNAFKAFMFDVKDGQMRNLKKRISLTGFREIEEICGEFNSMFDEVDSLTHRLVKTTTNLYETELEKKQAELNYLKSQINPHFLHNTLEVIIGMSVVEKAPQTTEMIKSLSKIFKYSVRGEDVAPAKNELDTVKAYLHIQQMRFYDAFDVKFDIDTAILDKKIPKMILQPIVENAISHGIEASEEKCLLTIGARLKNNYMEIWVEDDGVGMDKETLTYFRNIIEGTTSSVGKSIGLVNVINRLRLIYGKSFSMEIDSVINKGTKVTVIIEEKEQVNLLN